MDRSALRRPTGPVELPLSDSGAVALKQYFAARTHRFQDDNGKGWSSLLRLRSRVLLPERVHKLLDFPPLAFAFLGRFL